MNNRKISKQNDENYQNEVEEEYSEELDEQSEEEEETIEVKKPQSFSERYRGYFLNTKDCSQIYGLNG